MRPLSKQKISELRQETINFLTEWRNRFFLDWWWRRKHNVAFGSSVHREMNFLDMLIEYQEEIEIRKIFLEERRKEDEEWLGSENTVQLSQEEIDDDYNNLDLEQYNT